MITEERRLQTCPKCNEMSEPGMLFCIHCGKGLNSAADKVRRTGTIMMGGKCPSCGKEDDLNMRFCIYCSAAMSPETQPKPSDKFSWEMELKDSATREPRKPTDAALQFQSALRKTPTKKPLNLLPIGLIAGVILGGLAAFPGLKLSNLVERVWLSGTWPAKSLTVYTKHPFAQVTLYQPSDSRAYFLAETDGKGAVRFVNLEPGDYNLKITGKGLRTAFEQVSVESSRPTVIGYGNDKAIQLERDPKAPDANEAADPSTAAIKSKSSQREPDPSAAQPIDNGSKPADNGLKPVDNVLKPADNGLKPAPSEPQASDEKNSEQSK